MYKLHLQCFALVLLIIRKFELPLLRTKTPANSRPHTTSRVDLSDYFAVPVIVCPAGIRTDLSHNPALCHSPGKRAQERKPADTINMNSNPGTALVNHKHLGAPLQQLTDVV